MAVRRRASTKSRDCQEIVNDFMAENGEEIVDMMKAAAWAIANNRWKPPKFNPLKLCARELSRAAREEMYVDPQGRDVRKKHCFTIVDHDGQHIWRWFDIVNATKPQMHNSSQARRRSAFGDVSQLATDIGSWNDNNKFGAQIEMSFNFDEDLAEIQHPTVYPGDEEDGDLEDDSTTAST